MPLSARSNTFWQEQGPLPVCPTEQTFHSPRRHLPQRANSSQSVETVRATQPRNSTYPPSCASATWLLLYVATKLFFLLQKIQKSGKRKNETWLFTVDSLQLRASARKDSVVNVDRYQRLALRRVFFGCAASFDFFLAFGAAIFKLYCYGNQVLAWLALHVTEPDFVFRAQR